MWSAWGYGFHMDHITSAEVALIKSLMDEEDRAEAWVADKAGLARSTFHRKMRGGSDFTIVELYRIATALGRHPSELLPEQFREPEQAQAA